MCVRIELKAKEFYSLAEKDVFQKNGCTTRSITVADGIPKPLMYNFIYSAEPMTIKGQKQLQLTLPLENLPFDMRAAAS